MRVRDLESLSEDGLLRCQRCGYLDEHLTTFYALAYGDPYIYRDTYLIYSDSLSKMLSISLFGLNGEEDRLTCVQTALDKFRPNKFVVTSPEKLPSEIRGYRCEKTFLDRDYQINLKEFDEYLRGNSYEKLRYRTNNAKKRGYTLTVGKEMSTAHSYLIAVHMAKETYNIWDYQLYLKINEYITKFSSPRFFNVLLNGELIGFDILDVTGNVMVIPLGFYLPYPSLSDFLMYNELVYAKKQGFDWLDVGWSCNLGLEEFKKKWMAIPRFTVCVQEYGKNIGLAVCTPREDTTAIPKAPA